MNLKNKTERQGIIKLNTLDSLTAAKVNGSGKTFVLNFANDFHLGGCFLIGAVAQEKTICRSSRLYASISREKANKFYAFNKEHQSNEGTDFMLLSPNVFVFRDCNCNFLEKH